MLMQCGDRFWSSSSPPRAAIVESYILKQGGRLRLSGNTMWLIVVSGAKPQSLTMTNLLLSSANHFMSSKLGGSCEIQEGLP